MSWQQILGESYSNPEKYEQLILGFPFFREIVAKEIAAIFEKNLPENSKILDLACGSGIVSKKLTEKNKIVGFDRSEKFLRDAPIENRVLSDANQPLSFRENSFDGVTTVGANRYLKNLNSLSEIERILKPDGIFVWPIFLEESAIWKLRNHDLFFPTTPLRLKNELKKVGLETRLEISHLLKKPFLRQKPIYLVGQKN